MGQNLNFKTTLFVGRREYEPKYNINIVFLVLLEIHLVDLGITFNNYSEIHLNYRKYQMCSQILKLLHDHFRCCILHVETVFVYLI